MRRLTIVLAVLGIGPLLLLVDRVFVELGERHARLLCDGGPLRVYDETAWRAYSTAVRTSSRPGMTVADVDATRRGIGLRLSLRERRPSNPLFVTADYVQATITSSSSIIATWGFYRADKFGPIWSAIAIDGSGGYVCPRSNPAYNPEFEF